MNKARIRTIVILAAGVLALGACSSGKTEGSQDQVGKPATISHIHGLGVDATGVLYVATHYGLVRQSGDSWVYASADQDDHMGFSLQPNASVMYRSGHSQDRPSLGVESSTDGAQWTHLSDVADPPVDFHAMAVSFADKNSLWGWDSGGRGTFHSTDGGKSWTALQPKGIERQIYVLSGAAKPDEVYAGTMSGLHRSTDGGTTWQTVAGVGSGWVIAIGADPKDPKHLMAFAESGMRTTTDGGTTWTSAGTGLPKEVTSLAISPMDAKVAFAADSSKIYKTTDGGKTWTALTTG
jgi:photosystem II stability/assembly factor-like uncharacterized protein